MLAWFGLKPPLLPHRGVYVAQDQQIQASLFGTLGADLHQFLGVVLTPAFTHVKGQLWMAEGLVLKQLSNQNLNIDAFFMLPFTARVDARDSRPCTLCGRLAIGIGDKGLAESCWQHCSLVDRRRTEEAQQLPASLMTVLEECEEERLPETSWASDGSHSAVRGPKKFEQLGVDACSRIFDSTFNGLGKASHIGAVLVVDASMTTAEFLEAFVVKAVGSKMPTYFMGVSPEGGMGDWIQNHVVEALTARVKDGTLKIPGIELPQAPADQDPAPTQPQTKLLVVDSETQTLKVPEALVNEWGGHIMYGAAFQDALDDAQKVLGYSSPLEGIQNAKRSAAPSGEVGKRDGGTHNAFRAS